MDARMHALKQNETAKYHPNANCWRLVDLKILNYIIFFSMLLLCLARSFMNAEWQQKNAEQNS